jgi:putative phosphoribosyl transferase
MTFSSREEAGRRLGHCLAERGVKTDIVVGLPRGGVIVAAEVARVLQRPLDVIVVRKIGHPKYREFAVGAMAEHGVVLLDETAMAETRVERAELDKIIAREAGRLREYEAHFHSVGPRDFTNKSVLIVDDGLATGATTEAAIVSARKQGACEVIVAAPVASTKAVERLQSICDGVEAILVDPEFMAVGQYYEIFPQATDNEVAALLQSFRRPPAEV